MVHQEDAEVGQVVHIEELPQRGAVPPADHLLRPGHLGLMEAPDQRGQHMAVLGMVVVVGAVQVGGHHTDEIGAVLPVEELTVFQPGDFRQGVGLVGFLQSARQQAVLLHGLRRHARIDAAAPQKLQLFAVVLPGRMDHIHFQYHVLIHEIGQSRLVGLNAPHLGRRQKDIFRLFHGKKPFDGLLPRQVQLPVGPKQQIVIPLPLQFTDNRRTHHAAVAGDVYF